MIFEKKIAEAYRATAYTRCDDDGTARYFSAADFEGLSCHHYPFSAKAGHKLSGYIYSYDGAKENRLIVFDHGFGGGHRSYMKEIEMLARAGFTVFAYDHTGCMESGGENTNGMAQSLSDLDSALCEIKASGRFSGYEISVVGHSWGGFSTLNISALHPDIKSIVAISGFISVKKLIETNFPGILRPYRKAIMEIEREANPYYSEFDARESLKKSKCAALLIYSENDKLCKKIHYDLLLEALSDRPETEFILVKDKGHNPNYTKEAVQLLSEFASARAKAIKSESLKTNEEKEAFLLKFDFDKMTEQDAEVFEKIIEFLNK